MSEANMEKRFENLKLAEKGARVSIGAYIALSALKLGIGYFSGSKALFADGLNNATDIFSSIAVLVGLKISRKPADDEHAYGHLRAETIASLIASMIMIAVGLDVFVKAVKDTIWFTPKAPDLAAAGTALFCALAIYIVYRYNKKIAEKINSAGLMAAAKDNLSDAFVSIGTAVGIIASQFGMPWIDPLAAIVVGILIIKTGWDIFIEAVNHLTDGYDKGELDAIADKVKEVNGVLSVATIRARLHGNMTLLDLVIMVDPQITVKQGHEISILVETLLHDDFDITEVLIHVEPYGESH